MKLLIVSMLFITCQQVTSAEGGAVRSSLKDVDRAIVFGVEQEIQANHLEKRSDVCLGFGHGLTVDEKGIISELHRTGLKIHPNEWCNRGPRGLTISINAPVSESVQGTYDFVVELGDLRPIRQDGAHFGTLLRRGTYTVKCKGGSKPELVSYSQTCCTKTGNPMS